MQDHAHLCARKNNKSFVARTGKGGTHSSHCPHSISSLLCTHHCWCLKRTVKIWGTCDIFTQKCCFSCLCLCYTTAQKRKWNKDVFALLRYWPPPRAAARPSLGRQCWTCLAQTDVTSTGETSQGDDLQHQAAAENEGWPEERKVMTGKGQEQSKPGDRAASRTCSWSLFCQLSFQGLQKPGWEGTLSDKVWCL